jgi:hypothetical protein
MNGDPLHVTNGDSVVQTLERTGLPGRGLSWIDVLYEGPVPAGLDAAALARVRAEAAEALGWAPADEVEAAYAERDATLEAADHVVLWFEHDLHDQLQLVQILDRLAVGRRGRRLEAVIVDRVPGRETFHGLGELEPEELADLWPDRRPIDPAQLALAQRAWAALRAPDPTALVALAREGTPTLPLLGPALERLLEELPDAGDGLARSERQLLRAVGAGARTPLDAFAADAEQEEARHAGDTTVFARLDRLAAGPHPLVSGPPDGQLELTPDGERVLAGEVDAVRLRGLDRWVGGLHLTADAAWRWDAASRDVVRG